MGSGAVEILTPSIIDRGPYNLTPSVLMLARQAPPEFSGAGLQAARLAAILASAGVPVTMLSMSTEAHRPRLDHTLGFPRVRWPSMAFTPRAEKASYLTAIALHLVRRRPRELIVHVHGAHYVLRLLARLKPLLGFRVVYKATMLGMDDARAICDARGATALDVVDRWVCISRAIADATRAAGVPEERIVEIPNGLDLSEFRPARRGEREDIRAELGLSDAVSAWMTVGAVVRRKRMDVMVRAWSRLSDREARLLVVGPLDLDPVSGAPTGSVNEYAAELRDLADELGLADRVRFLGGRQDVSRLLRGMDGLLFASRQEGSPNAVYEALASGLPVVSTELSARDDLLAAAPGMVAFADDDPDAIAALVEAAPAPSQQTPPGVATTSFGLIAGRYVELYRGLA